MEQEQITQEAADEIFQEEAGKVWDQEDADELSATPEEPQKPAAKEADETTPEETPPPDEWAGVPDVVKNRLLAAEAEIARREHAIKSQMGRELAAMKRQLDEANAKLAPKAAETPPPELTKWNELKQEFEPIAGGVEEYVAQMIKGIAAPQSIDIEALEQRVAERARVEAASDIVESFHGGWTETIASQEFLAWKKLQEPGFQRLYESNRPRDAIKVLDKFKADQAAAEKARRVQAERDARLKGSTTVRGQGTGVITDEQTLSADQLWEIEAAKVWKERA